MGQTTFCAENPISRAKAEECGMQRGSLFPVHQLVKFFFDKQRSRLIQTAPGKVVIVRQLRPKSESSSATPGAAASMETAFSKTVENSLSSSSISSLLGFVRSMTSSLAA